MNYKNNFLIKNKKIYNNNFLINLNEILNYLSINFENDFNLLIPYFINLLNNNNFSFKIINIIFKKEFYLNLTNESFFFFFKYLINFQNLNILKYFLKKLIKKINNFQFLFININFFNELINNYNNNLEIKYLISLLSSLISNFINKNSLENFLILMFLILFDKKSNDYINKSKILFNLLKKNLLNLKIKKINKLFFNLLNLKINEINNILFQDPTIFDENQIIFFKNEIFLNLLNFYFNQINFESESYFLILYRIFQINPFIIENNLNIIKLINNLFNFL